MKINAPAGELITDFLYKQTGRDDDALEAEFYRLNPHVCGEVFRETTPVILPVVSFSQSPKKPTRSWD